MWSQVWHWTITAFPLIWCGRKNICFGHPTLRIRGNKLRFPYYCRSIYIIRTKLEWKKNFTYFFHFFNFSFFFFSFFFFFFYFSCSISFFCFSYFRAFPSVFCFIQRNSFLLDEVLTSLLRLSYGNVGWRMYQVRNNK